MMFGRKDDVPGECNAHCYIYDDQGDNYATMRCQQPTGHEGEHREQYKADLPNGAGSRIDEDGNFILVTWTVDERQSR